MIDHRANANRKLRTTTFSRSQESGDSTDTEGAKTERQRPDREQARQRRENMSDEDRAAARERWDNMSDEDRQAARDKMRERRGGKHPKGDRPQGKRQPKAENDDV